MSDLYFKCILPTYDKVCHKTITTLERACFNEASRGCHSLQWQKKEEEKDKKEKYTPLFSVSGTSEPTNEDPMEMKCDVKQ